MIERIRVPRARAALTFLAVAGLWSAAGHAETLLTETPLIRGYAADVAEVEAPGAGKLTVSVSDVGAAVAHSTKGWITALSSLSFAVTSPTSVFGCPNSPGTCDSFSIAVSGPGLYSVVVNAKASDTSFLSLGWYKLQVSFTPAVPLPASAWLLLSGLAGLAFAWRGKRPLLCLPPIEAPLAT